MEFKIFVQGDPATKKVFLTSGFQLPFQEHDLISQIDNAAMFQGFSSGGCYDEKTKVLTNHGWKYFNELNGSEEFYTLNPKTRTIELQPATGFINYHYRGKMYHFKSKTLDLLVTPDHNMAVSGYKKEYKEIKLIKAKDLVKNYMIDDIELPQFGIWEDGYDKNEIEINGLKYETEDFVRFIAYYLSDGYIINESKHYDIILTANNGRKAKEYREILKRLSLDFKETKTQNGSVNFVISNKKLWNFLSSLNKDEEKHVPGIIKNMSKRFLEVFLKALVFKANNTVESKISFYTSSFKLAEDIQEIAMKLGRNALIDKSTRRYVINNLSSINNKSLTVYKVCIEKTKSSIIENVDIIDYDGQVYCVEVPNHILYVKREKSPVWCGNSILHLFTNEELTPEQQIKMVKSIMCNFPVYYMTKTPFLTTCNACGHKMVGKHNKCESCNSDDVTVWSRPIGYFRPVMRKNINDNFDKAEYKFWLDGRIKDFATRKEVTKEDVEMLIEEINSV